MRKQSRSLHNSHPGYVAVGARSIHAAQNEISTMRAPRPAGFVPLQFPATRAVLWDRRPTGQPVAVHLSQYREPVIVVEEKTLRLAHRFSQETSEDTYRCIFIGSLSVEPDGTGVTISVDRFKTPHNDHDQSLSSLSPGEVYIPCVVKKNSAKPCSSVEDYESAVQVLHERCTCKSRVDLSHFMCLRANCSYHGNQQSFIFHLDFDLVSMATALKMTPVNAIPVVPTALSKNLSGPLSMSEVQGEAKTGYLTMDHTRKLLLTLESDPKVYSLPLVGIWVSGLANIHDPFIWASCLRYLFNASLKEKICCPPEAFLVVLYSPLHSKPEFYECVTSDGKASVAFSLKSCHEVIQLPKDYLGRAQSPLELETVAVESGDKRVLFDAALERSLGALKTDSCDIQNSSDLQLESPQSGSMEDITPRSTPAPCRAQAPMVTPSVPEVSLLFDDPGRTLSRGSVSGETTDSIPSTCWVGAQGHSPAPFPRSMADPGLLGMQRFQQSYQPQAQGPRQQPPHRPMIARGVRPGLPANHRPAATHLNAQHQTHQYHPSAPPQQLQQQPHQQQPLLQQQPQQLQQQPQQLQQQSHQQPLMQQQLQQPHQQQQYLQQHPRQQHPRQQQPQWQQPYGSPSSAASDPSQLRGPPPRVYANPPWYPQGYHPQRPGPGSHPNMSPATAVVTQQYSSSGGPTPATANSYGDPAQRHPRAAMIQRFSAAQYMGQPPGAPHPSAAECHRATVTQSVAPPQGPQGVYQGQGHGAYQGQGQYSVAEQSSGGLALSSHHSGQTLGADLRLPARSVPEPQPQQSQPPPTATTVGGIQPPFPSPIQAQGPGLCHLTSQPPKKADQDSANSSPGHNSGSTDSGMQSNDSGDSGGHLDQTASGASVTSQIPSDVYELLKVQDEQLRLLREQLQELTMRQNGGGAADNNATQPQSNPVPPASERDHDKATLTRVKSAADSSLSSSSSSFSSSASRPQMKRSASVPGRCSIAVNTSLRRLDQEQHSNGCHDNSTDNLTHNDTQLDPRCSGTQDISRGVILPHGYPDPGARRRQSTPPPDSRLHAMGAAAAAPRRPQLHEPLPEGPEPGDLDGLQVGAPGSNDTLSMEEWQLTGIQNRTEESIMSDMLVDMPAYTSISPEKTEMGNSDWYPDSDRSPVLGESVSMYERQDTPEPDGEDELDAGLGESHPAISLLYNKQFYENLIGNVQKLLHNRSGTSVNNTTARDTTATESRDTTATDRRTPDTPLQGSRCHGVQGTGPDYSTDNREESYSVRDQTVDVAALTRKQLLDMGVNLEQSGRESEKSSSCDQSTYLHSIMLPKINYVSMFLDGSDTDQSTAADSLAMKYLSDEQLSELARLRTSPRKAAPRGGGLDRVAASAGAKSDVSTYGMSANHMSFASRKYLERYGLLGEGQSPEDTGTDSPSEGEVYAENPAVLNIQDFLRKLSESSFVSTRDGASLNETTASASGRGGGHATNENAMSDTSLLRCADGNATCYSCQYSGSDHSGSGRDATAAPLYHSDGESFRATGRRGSASGSHCGASSDVTSNRTPGASSSPAHPSLRRKTTALAAPQQTPRGAGNPQTPRDGGQSHQYPGTPGANPPHGQDSNKFGACLGAGAEGAPKLKREGKPPAKILDIERLKELPKLL